MEFDQETEIYRQVWIWRTITMRRLAFHCGDIALEKAMSSQRAAKANPYWPSCFTCHMHEANGKRAKIAPPEGQGVTDVLVRIWVASHPLVWV